MPCLPLPEHDRHAKIPWPDPNQPLCHSVFGTLTLDTVHGQGLARQSLNQLSIRFSCGGERFQLCGRRHRQSLKKLLYNMGLPPWERQRVPLLYSAETLIAVAGLGISAPHRVPYNEVGYVLQWQKPVQFVNV